MGRRRQRTPQPTARSAGYKPFEELLPGAESSVEPQVNDFSAGWVPDPLGDKASSGEAIPGLMTWIKKLGYEYRIRLANDWCTWEVGHQSPDGRVSSPHCSVVPK